MNQRIKQILGASKSKSSVNTDTYLNVEFNSTQKLLPPDEINNVVDLGEQYNLERQSSTFYRIHGKIDPLVTNVLFNTTGSGDCWEIFSTDLFTNNGLDEDQPNATFAQSISKSLKEIEGWWGYFSPVLTGTGLCNFYDMEPKRERFSFIPDTTNTLNVQVKNWELTITYPYSADTTHPMVNGGLLIVDKMQAIVGGKLMTALSVPVFHNLLNGGTIRLKNTNMDGDYDVKRVGLDNGDLKSYYLCIDVDFSSLSLGSNSRITKLYNGVESNYYFRKFKKINTRSGSVVETDDYEVYKLGFSENIFTDDVTQFVFNEDIDVSNLVDNLGRPLSELFLTTIKTDSNGIFTNITSGIEGPLISEFNTANINSFLKDIPVIQKIHGVNPISAASQTFNALESNVDVDNDDFYGDVVEYNITTIEEINLADVFHRFNTINRETTSDLVVVGPRPEGYYYKAHQLIKIRNFSSYIEEGTSTTAGMPDYTIDLGDGRFIWRDLLDIGAVDIKQDTINYPFVNGCHYLYQNYMFNVRRQDPFDDWDLYFANFPADPIGGVISLNFKVSAADQIC